MADSKFEWAQPSTEAAELLAQGRLSDVEIAEAVGVSRTTLYRWRKHPDFAAKVDEHLETFRLEVRRRGLAIRDQRVAALNDRWTRMRRVMEARADDPSMADVPGGSTGLMVRTVKGLGSGDSFRTVEEYEVDAALLRELREHEKQAAQELGQWIEKREIDQILKGYLTESPDTLCPSPTPNAPTSLTEPPETSGGT